MLACMQPEPLFRVTRGTPTAEELAALVGALFTGRARPAPEPVPPSRWRVSALPAARTPRPGPGAWRATGLPR
jgi:hypothetical protein